MKVGRKSHFFVKVFQVDKILSLHNKVKALCYCINVNTMYFIE